MKITLVTAQHPKTGKWFCQAQNLPEGVGHVMYSYDQETQVDAILQWFYEYKIMLTLCGIAEAEVKAGKYSDLIGFEPVEAETEIAVKAE